MGDIGWGWVGGLGWEKADGIGCGRVGGIVWGWLSFIGWGWLVGIGYYQILIIFKDMDVVSVDMQPFMDAVVHDVTLSYEIHLNLYVQTNRS